jgi:NSS family neurotransmitter:Na+ symporter
VSIERGVNGHWRSRWTFILAAAGSAVGLGNIWKFPYITGENGGGAFVLVYLLCIALVGLPIMLAETLLGKRAKMSPINAMLYLSKESGHSSLWSGIGWSGMITGILILSFYSVVAGWSLHYFLLYIHGQFFQIEGEASGALFGGLLSNIGILVTWHTVFLIVALVIVSAGVIKGLGVAVRYLMPLLFFLMVLLFIYSAIVGEFGKAFHFLFDFKFSALSGESIIVALGHAFFTLSLGMGAIMAYGAYLPEDDSMREMSLGKIILVVGGLDTLIAILAGLVIFPIVFASPSIEPGQGPGLLFVSLPIAFGGMTAGSLFAAIFFFLIFIAALSSAISMIEPTVAWLVETKAWQRVTVTLSLGVVVWIIGLGTVFSFNIWAENQLFGKTFFDLLDFLTANILLPLGGLFIAIFVGWLMKSQFIEEELGDINQGLNHYWYLVLKYISPFLLAIVFVMAFFK